ncbi:MAG: hypothetical protein ACPHCI_09595 [Solirubrobacterales bacterium]
MRPEMTLGGGIERPLSLVHELSVARTAVEIAKRGNIHMRKHRSVAVLCALVATLTISAIAASTASARLIPYPVPLNFLQAQAEEEAKENRADILNELHQEKGSMEEAEKEKLKEKLKHLMIKLILLLINSVSYL